MDLKAALWSLTAMFIAAPGAWQPAGTPPQQYNHHHHLHLARPSINIHPLRPLLGSGGRAPADGVTCSSWRLGVETNNVRGFKTIPAGCQGYMGNYMLGDRYRQDSAVVTAEAAAYAKGLDLSGDGTDVWVFDIDETSLSNLPYYSNHGFGAEPYNATAFDEWVVEGTAPALPETLKLYRNLLSLGIKVIFLTGRAEKRRNVTGDNLRSAGFTTWEKLLLKGEGATDNTQFKSGERAKLEKAGYRIVGNMGDQWSDILGSPEGGRTFKLPDPMYYIS